MSSILVPAPLARGARGAVVAPHHLAAAAGLGILRAGGHAVDAAIATNAVLAVVMPNGCGLGGDAFWLVWDEAAGTLSALNGSGSSATTADAAALRRAGLAAMPRRGPLSITVPGAVRSWADAQARFGRLPRQTVLAPAIELAEQGFAMWDGLASAVERTRAAISAGRGSWADAFEAVFRPHGRPWRAGERCRQPLVARTLRRLADDGYEDFYEGVTARTLAAALEAAGSELRAGDLAGHRSTWGEPLRRAYRGVEVATHPPNSVGVVALQTLALLERFEAPASAAFGAAAWSDARWIHLGLEAAKLAYRDRALVADPAEIEVDTAGILDQRHVAELGAAIDPERADPAPTPTRTLVGGTIYLATVDSAGNAVSLIQSNASGFGSGVVDPLTGVNFQNRGQSFLLDPDEPAVLGPRRRPVHSLVPAMLLRDGRPWVVLGSMGGDAQTQIVTQLTSAFVDGAADPATAVGAPRWFVGPAGMDGPPVTVTVEPRLAPGVAEDLAGRGHATRLAAPFDSDLGHAHAIELVDGGPARGGTLAAATDPRSEGLPAVW